MGSSGPWKLCVLYSQVENKGRPSLYVKNVCKYAYIPQKARIYHRRHVYTTEGSEAVKVQKVKKRSGEVCKSGSVCKT